MASGIDFLRLYREFQLKPGADIDDLKRAYRRRVSMVHPDRLDASDAISQHLATEHLQRLTTLYEAGVQFHRQHGRLPGASTVTDPDTQTSADGNTAEVNSVAPAKAATHRLRWTLIVIALACVLVWWSWPASPPEAPVVNHSAPTTRATALGARPAIPASVRDGILVGMRKAEVQRIQGAPVMREGERWLYGPSWILFRDGKVAEWYSSPLHPLRIASNSGS